MQIIRTPDERFANLPGYPFTPNYVEVDGLRMHYVDEGLRDGAVVLMLHGEPSWSYLYRKMIPVVAGAGLRAVAPDLIGFGRSDKIADRREYTYQRHMDWTRGFVEALDLRDATLVCQDWGGLIGLRLAAENPDRFARVVAANTGILTGDIPMPKVWHEMRAAVESAPVLDIGRAVQAGCTTTLAPEVRAAYEAPFPDEGSKEGARAFPGLVPITPEDPAAPACRAAVQALAQWTKPFLTAFSDGDPITRGADKLLAAFIPGAANQPHTTITNAGHFLQEDKGEELAEVVVEFVTKTS